MLYSKPVFAGSFAVFLLFLVFFSACGKAPEMDEAYNNKTLLQDLYPDKAVYRPGEEAKFFIELKNTTEKEFGGIIRIRIKKIDELVYEEIGEIPETVLNAGEEKILVSSWLPPKTPYQGYMMEVSALSGKNVLDSRNTAVDVSPDWKYFPRYGYLCHYEPMDDEDIDAVVQRLSKYHLNGIQYYDWQDSHHAPLAGTPAEPAPEWKDISGALVSGKIIRRYIEKFREKNMYSAAYNLMFGAYEDYSKWGISAEWGLYKDSGRRVQDRHDLPRNWESDLYLMNPGDPRWQNFLLQKQKEAFEVYPFDAFHIDTLGHRGTRYDYWGNEIDLEKAYESFLKRTEEMLDLRLIGNPVNGYGASAFAAADTDFLYTELWPASYPRYNDLRRAVLANAAFSKNQKTTVLAAYINYALKGEFNPPAVKYADALIFASGASHLELGDTGMLGNEYFPNRDKMISADLEEDMRIWYDFITAYETLLCRTKVEEFSGTLEGISFSGEPEAGKIWVSQTSAGAFRIIHLVNFASLLKLEWRDDEGTYKEPAMVSNIRVILDIPSKKEVYLASPDFQGGSLIPLAVEIKKQKLMIPIPKLKYWDMIIIND